MYDTQIMLNICVENDDLGYKRVYNFPTSPALCDHIPCRMYFLLLLLYA